MSNLHKERDPLTDPAVQITDEELRLYIVNGFLDFIVRHKKSGSPPLCMVPEADRLLEVLADVCPGFPMGEKTHDVLYMFAMGFGFGMETATKMIRTHEETDGQEKPRGLPQ